MRCGVVVVDAHGPAAIPRRGMFLEYQLWPCLKDHALHGEP